MLVVVLTVAYNTSLTDLNESVFWNSMANDVLQFRQSFLQVLCFSL